MSHLKGIKSREVIQARLLSKSLFAIVIAEAGLTGHPWPLLYESESTKGLSVEIIARHANCLIFKLKFERLYS